MNFGIDLLLIMYQLSGWESRINSGVNSDFIPYLDLVVILRT